MDNVNHPAHYGGADNPYEAIKVIDAWGLGFDLGNAVKYIARAGKKTPSELEDLRKAQWYLGHRIQQLEAGIKAVQQAQADQLRAKHDDKVDAARAAVGFKPYTFGADFGTAPRRPLFHAEDFIRQGREADAALTQFDSLGMREAAREAERRARTAAINHSVNAPSSRWTPGSPNTERMERDRIAADYPLLVGNAIRNGRLRVVEERISTGEYELELRHECGLVLKACGSPMHAVRHRACKELQQLLKARGVRL